MKKIFFLSLLFISLVSQAETQCAEWLNALNGTVSDPKSESWTLKKEKTHRDLLNVIKGYPFPSIINPHQTQSESDYQDVLTKIRENGSCEYYLFYKARTGFLLNSSVPKKLKKEFIQSLLESKSHTTDGSLISLMLSIGVFKTAVSNDILKLSDTLYFEIGSIEAQAKAMSEELKDMYLKIGLSAKCHENLKSCSSKEIKDVYNWTLYEFNQADKMNQRLQWWIKRVKI